MIELFTDGACSGNPGPGGWGVLIIINGVERSISGFEYDTTNNRMELTAAINGLDYLQAPCTVKLFTDSVYLKNGITKWIHKWKENNWKTSSGKSVKNKDLWQKLELLVKKHEKVDWLWVKGHSGNSKNDKADTLAKSAIYVMLNKD